LMDWLVLARCWRLTRLAAIKSDLRIFKIGTLTPQHTIKANQRQA
jgi:hypothetical protein